MARQNVTIYSQKISLDVVLAEFAKKVQSDIEQQHPDAVIIGTLPIVDTAKGIVVYEVNASMPGGVAPAPEPEADSDDPVTISGNHAAGNL